MSKYEKNPKIEDISEASSLGSEDSFFNMKHINNKIKTPEEMTTPPTGVAVHMSHKDMKKIGNYPKERIMKSYGTKNYIPEILMEKSISPAKLRSKLNKIVKERERNERRNQLIKDLKDFGFGGGKKKTRKKKRRIVRGKGRKKKKTRKRKKRNKTRKKSRKRKKRKLHHTVKLKLDKCSPKKSGDMLKFTCYTKDSLFKLKEIWNARHRDNKILTNDPKLIWGFLHTHMSNTCNRESCWLKKNWIKEKIPKKIMNNTFAPKQPEIWKRKPTEWLTSIDILNVMKQYETTYKNFEFMGPSPIDFDTHKLYGECVWEELCKFSLKEQISRGKNKIGVIFNLDRHHEPGSHWVALYIDMIKKEIYYFDSYADPPPKEIGVLVKRIQKESLGIGKEYKFIKNRRRHQWSNSECGMYCLYFIITLLKGGSFNKFERKRVDDKLMKKLRNIYFNKI